MGQSRKISIDDINAMKESEFVSKIGYVFEESPWVAALSWEKAPFDSISSMIEILYQTVKDASDEQQMSLLCSHPELGTRKKLTQASENEQIGAGLKSNSAVKLNPLMELNKQYREKFGFPFIIAVKGHTPQSILENLMRRLGSDVKTEFKECQEQVFKIVEIRLADILMDEK